MSELRMPAVNQVSIAGRLVQDPEYRITDNGSARLSARIAVNRSYRDRDGEWQDEASFFNLVAWQKLAEFGAERLRKGTPVFLTGRLRSHSWRDEEENPHSIVEIQVRNLQILERNVSPDSMTGVEIDQDGDEELELGAVAA